MASQHSRYSSCIINNWLLSLQNISIVQVYCGDPSDPIDPNNFLGISLVCCLAKLFTNIINNRLIEWSKTYDTITDAQFGFRQGLSTVDALFALQSVITKTLLNKNIVALLTIQRHLTLLTDLIYGINCQK